MLGLEDLGPVSREHLQARMNGSEVSCDIKSSNSRRVETFGRIFRVEIFKLYILF